MAHSENPKKSKSASSPDEEGEHAHHGEEEARHSEKHNPPAHHEEGEEGEPWLLSYADMVTLLMCFFILFFSLDKTKGGVSDPKRIKEKLESLIGIDQTVLMKKPKSSEGKASEKKAVELVKDISDKIREITAPIKVMFSISQPEPGVVELVLLNSSFFESGRAIVTTAGLQMIAAVSPKLNQVDPTAVIEIEGHTDADPVRSKEFATNWELSSARASSVAHELIARGLSPKNVSVVGRADQRPLARERDERGLAIASAKKVNRRIVIRVKFPS